MTVRNIFALLCLVLAGCGPTLQETLQREQALNPLTLSQRKMAVLVMSTEGPPITYMFLGTQKSSPAGITTAWAPMLRDASTLFVNANTQAKFHIDSGATAPSMIEVEAGTYDMVSFTIDTDTTGRNKLTNARNLQPGQFMARVQLNPGEVIYAGHLYIAPIYNGFLKQQTFALAVTDEEAKARESLGKRNPQTI